MFFILLTFFAALFIEGLGSLVSVIGISALFGANPIIIALAISLDVGKVVVVSLLYTYWRELTALMKTYALLAATVTMIITSSGAAGYLSGEFQKAIIGTKEGEVKVSVLQEQQARLQERKKQIDNQIANLPANYSRARVTLMKQFEGEQKQVTDQLAKIDQELPQLQIAQLGTEAKAGPIIQIAKAFDIPVEQAVKYVIFMIIFVFDPLAIFLIIAGNFLWAHRKKGDPTIPFEPPEAMPPAPRVVDDVPETDHNNVFMKEDGTVIRPQTPDFMKTEPVPPLFEVLQPTPKEPPPLDPNWRQDTSMFTQPEPEVLAVEPVGEEFPANERIDVQPIPIGRKIPRQEIASSSFSDVSPDPRTIVDAGRNLGFRKSSVVIVPPKSTDSAE